MTQEDSTELEPRWRLNVTVAPLTVPIPGGGVGFTYVVRWPDQTPPHVSRVRLWPTPREAVAAGMKMLENAVEGVLKNFEKGNTDGKTQG